MTTRTDNLSGPYAPGNNVLAVIRRRRERGLVFPITGQVLGAVGIPEGNQPRTLAALRFLGLVDEEGNSTGLFDRINDARTEEYPQVLGEIIRGAYNPVFTMVDPSQDGDIALYDAFRQYHPEAQRQRMVALFRALCEEAEIIERGPRPRTSRSDQQRPPRAGAASASSKGRRSKGQPANSRTGEAQGMRNREAPGTVFGLTEDDIGLLGEADFDEIWRVLGKVAWARGQAKIKQSDSNQPDIEEPIDGPVS